MEGIEKDEKYKNCIEKLKEYTLKDKGKEVKKTDSGKSTQVIMVENNTKKDKEILQNSEEQFVERKKEDNKNIEETKGNSTNENKREIKGSLFQIFKYSSIRYILIILSVGWFCNSTLFYGLVLGIKTLKGSQYRNTAILYLCDFFAYNISGLFSNSRLGRRWSLQIFTIAYGIFSLVMFLVYDKNKDVVVAFYFLCKISNDLWILCLLFFCFRKLSNKCRCVWIYFLCNF